MMPPKRLTPSSLPIRYRQWTIYLAPSGRTVLTDGVEEINVNLELPAVEAVRLAKGMIDRILASAVNGRC